MPEPIRSFEEFWPYYVQAHSKKGTRVLHFIGTTAAMSCVAGAVLLKKPWLLAAAPVVGYGPAWIGHFFVEGNKPATFGNPVWSLQADLKMWAMTLRGEMDAEVARVAAEAEATRKAANGEAQQAAAAHRETLN